MRRLITLALLLCGAPAGALDLVSAHRAAVEHDAEFAAEVSAAEAGREYAVQSRAALAPRVNLTGQVGKLDMETRKSGDLSSLLSSDTSGKVYGYGLSITRPLYRPDLKADARNLAAQADIAALTFKTAQQDLILRVSLAYPDQSRALQVGVQFSMPVFAGGALQSRYRQALAQRNQARQELEAARREVDVDVREAYTQVTSGALRVAALEQGLVSAQMSLEAAELGREVGNRTNLDVLTLQQQLYDVKRDLADARYGYLLTQLKLAALAGELTENHLAALTSPAP